MKSAWRTLGWAIAVIWAAGMTLAVARIARTLDSIAARPNVPPVASPAAGPSEVAISLRASPAAPSAPPGPGSVDDRPTNEASPEQRAAQQEAEAVLAQIVENGSVDDDSAEALRQAITAMRPQDRIRVLSAFAAAATRGEIAADPEDYRRILP
jgi:hypothetical protein